MVPDGQSSIRPVKLCIVGVPGSGKTTTAGMLAAHFGVPLVHGSREVIAACPGDWIEKGDMAPEPCATDAVEAVLAREDEWVLDGFPRTITQLESPFVRREAIVYLDISYRGALRRASLRGRADQRIEEHRIAQQSMLLIPVKSRCAVVIPVTYRNPEQVTEAIIRWYDHNIHPSELGSNAR